MLAHCIEVLEGPSLGDGDEAPAPLASHSIATTTYPTVVGINYLYV